jgi:hypothetical protein
MLSSTRRMLAFAAVAAGLAIAMVTPGVAAAADKDPADRPTVAAVTEGVAPLGIHTCDPGDFCAYYLSNFAGGLYAWPGSDNNWTNNILANGASIDNDDMSWWNRGTACAGCDAVRVFDGIGYAAPRTICLTRGQSVSSNPSAANRGSSHSWYGSC